MSMWIPVLNETENEAKQEVFEILKASQHAFIRKNAAAEARIILRALPQQEARSASLRRAEAEPLQYILGKQWVLNHDYRVRPGVLIPRPETEWMISRIVRELKKNNFKEKQWLGCEIGFGSGAISIELLSEFQNLKMVATDISLEAHSCAMENAVDILGSLDRLCLVYPTAEDDVILDQLKESEPNQFQFLVSNPPYLCCVEDEIEYDVLNFEPKKALFPVAKDPLYFYNEIAANAGLILKGNGKIFLEIPHERAGQIFILFKKFGWSCVLEKDLTGRFRFLSGVKNYG